MFKCFVWTTGKLQKLHKLYIEVLWKVYLLAEVRHEGQPSGKLLGMRWPIALWGFHCMNVEGKRNGKVLGGFLLHDENGRLPKLWANSVGGIGLW